VITAKPQILRQDGVTKGYQPLKIGERSIAAAYLPQSLGKSRGAVLLLHDINEHIDSAAIGILRRQLPAHGWDTLAIKIIRFGEDAAPQATTENEETQVASDDATVDADNQAADSATPEDTAAENNEIPAEAEVPIAQAETFTVITTAQRIDAALAKLQQEGHDNIVLVGQGTGGQLALKTISETAVPIAALIMINAGEIDGETNILDSTIPTLEIVGSRQKDSVKDAALTRQTQMKTEQRTNYQLRQIAGADHYFSSTVQALTNQVHGWLFKQLFDEEASR